MKIFIRENTMRSIVNEKISNLFKELKFGGWGNGYVLIPKEHSLYGKSTEELHKLGIIVHGGITFNAAITKNMIVNLELNEEDLEKWCVGFDTNHFDDDLTYWSKERVYEEAENLKNQLIKYEKDIFG